MVTKTTIKTSNAALQAQHPLVAVFVGATSGIAFNTLKGLAKQANSPKVYLVGRSREKAAPMVAELRSLSPNGTFEFIAAQTSLLHDVDAVCKTIKEKEKYIDLLFMATGGLNLGARNETTEGLDTLFSASYYSRMRFTMSLLPLLNASPNYPRVVSILGAGQEGAVNVSDLGLKDNYSVLNYGAHTGTMTSLVFDKLASENRNISFVHAFPGFVATELLTKTFGTLTGWWTFVGTLASWFVVPLLMMISSTPEDAGEIALFEATNEMYKGEGKEGGFFRVQPNGDFFKESLLLEKYKTDGTQGKIWQDLMDTFDRISAQG